MILLDTNVLSELMRPTPHEVIVDWVDRQLIADLHISVITLQEIERGLNLLPEGKRRRDLRIEAEATINDFEGRCLPYGKTAAVLCGRLAAQRQLTGRPIGIGDAQIASISLIHDMWLATRNTRDFQYIEGLNLINPWETGG